VSQQQVILIGLASLLVLGVGGQLIAARQKLPAILVLLLFGLAAGPGTEWLARVGALPHRFLDPNELLGSLLLPVVSLSVAIVLFEGGLTLNVADLANEAGRTLRNLVSAGALVTWIGSAAAAHWAAGLPWAMAWLIGAILVVTGPTVIGPLLRHVKPVGRVAAILKWEGIVIDPIGAILAVLVFEAINVGGVPGGIGPRLPNAHLFAAAAWQMARSALVGGALGLAASAAIVLLLRRYWVPDLLQNAVVLMLVVATFTASNVIQPESGLVTVTVMGIVLANQRYVPVRHILEFKENLSVLLIGSLFILLASRLRLDQLERLGWRSLAFLAAMVFVVRPASVAASTFFSGLSLRERLFLAWMAPRGIVAASVTSIFAIRLREAGYEGADRLVPLMFAVIIGTVLIYGLTARPLAGYLGLRPTGPSGFLIAGANPLARAIARALRGQGSEVLLADTNRPNVEAARAAGLPALYASVTSPYVWEKVEASGIGRLLAVTPSEEVNSLAVLHYGRHFGRDNVFQLATGSEESRRKERVAREFRGRMLFARGLTYSALAERLGKGAAVRVTPADAAGGGGGGDGRAVPMFVRAADGQVNVITPEEASAARPGASVISLVDADTIPLESDGAAKRTDPT
jgi:NhaP-type Na+/H+ or K+/H+ antiporter